MTTNARLRYASGQDKPLVCLAGSGGGHVRQLLDLELLWSNYPHFFVTEDTALGRSIAKKTDTEFVPHFAIGQARLGSPLKMLGQALRSLSISLRIIWRRRPQIVITTGAGSQLFVVAWARLLGARIILIDSFARFDGPSAFARIAGPLAHRRYTQSAIAAEHWPGAIVHDPLRQLDTEAPPKQDLLFATVGATLPFERLTRLVLEAVQAGTIPEDVVVQAGATDQLPEGGAGLSVLRELPFQEVQELLSRARYVVCHGGTGSIITALQNHCRVVVIPRRFDLGEHYDDHQMQIAENFAKRGLVHIAHNAESLREALACARQTVPVPVTTDYSNLIAELSQYIEGIASEVA